MFIVTHIVGVCNCSMFCFTFLYVHSSIAIILMGKKELVALPNLSSWCLVVGERLFPRCYGVVCGLWLWYFLVILTYFFPKDLSFEIKQHPQLSKVIFKYGEHGFKESLALLVYVSLYLFEFIAVIYLAGKATSCFTPKVAWYPSNWVSRRK